MGKRAKKVVIDEGKQLVIDMLGDAIKIIIKSGVGYEPQENGLKEIWEQVKAAVEGYVGAYKEELKKLVTKYKPRIIAELKRAKQVVIDMLGDAIKIIIKSGVGDEPQENGLKEIWEKIKSTARKIKGVVSEKTLKVLEKYKPKILDAVKGLKDVVIACGKDLVIQVKDGIIKIITDGSVTVSDDSPAENFYFEDGYAMVIYENAEYNGLENGWQKVKDAFKKLGEKIMRKSLDMWKRIVPAFKPIFEKYKDLIVKALIGQGKVIIDEGRKVVVTVIDDIVKVIIDGIEAASGEKSFYEEDNGLKEIWEKVKAAVQEQAGHYKKEIDALVKKYKPRIVDQLQKVKKVVISEGKTLVIEMLGDAIKIIIKGGIGYEEESNDENGLKE